MRQASTERRPLGASATVPIRRDQITGSYYTAQPAPTQWVAVATIVSHDRPGTYRLVVGSGTSEASAVAALDRRLTALTPPEPAARNLLGLDPEAVAATA